MNMQPDFIVLIIDDDRIFQFLTQKTLESSGFVQRIFVCSDGQEAMDLLKNNMHNADNLPDVIFLDINMPVMNGWEFLEAFKDIKPSLNKSVPVYIVSSSANDADIERSKEYDTVEGYLTKPIMKEQFIEILSRLPQQKVSHTTNSH